MWWLLGTVDSPYDLLINDLKGIKLGENSDKALTKRQAKNKLAGVCECFVRVFSQRDAFQKTMLVNAWILMIMG